MADEGTTQTPATATPKPEEKKDESTPAETAHKETPKPETKPAVKEPSQEPKPKETPAKETPAAPEKYDLKAKEGSFLQDGALERTISYAKEWGLSNEEAQELLDQQADAIADYVEAGKKQAQGWLENAKKDKELGGDNWSKSEALAKRGYDKHVHPELNHIMQETGLANHPEVIRFFARLGSSMADDTVIPAGSQPGKKERSTAELFYGAEKKE